MPVVSDARLAGRKTPNILVPHSAHATRTLTYTRVIYLHCDAFACCRDFEEVSPGASEVDALCRSAGAALAGERPHRRSSSSSSSSGGRRSSEGSRRWGIGWVCNRAVEPERCHQDELHATHSRSSRCDLPPPAYLLSQALARVQRRLSRLKA